MTVRATSPVIVYVFLDSQIENKDRIYGFSILPLKVRRMFFFQSFTGIVKFCSFVSRYYMCSIRFVELVFQHGFVGRDETTVSFLPRS